MIVLVCGGRNYDDARAMRVVLDYLHQRLGFTTVIEGEARGADSMARMWAEAVARIPVVKYPAQWRHADGSHNRRAGFERNTRMLQHPPQLVVAFPGGRGTADTVAQARALGIQVMMAVDIQTKMSGTNDMDVEI